MKKVRVGILGSKTIRNGQEPQGKGQSVNAGRNRPKGKFDASTNAAIGAIHEFGVPGKMPQRSFLRMPITEQLQKELESHGAFGPEELKKVVKEGSTVPWLHRIAVVAEKIVGDAFATGGFGKWRPSDMKYKTVHQTLVETQQLRNSITSEVK
jgi:phage gpG-like protein